MAAVLPTDFRSRSMARLKALRPRLDVLAPRIGRVAGDEVARNRQRDAEQGWRRWYKTARWQALRWSVLVRDRFTCQMDGCGKLDADTSRLVADHKVPHRGDERLFWDAGNLQCLCKACHDRLKQRTERRDR